MSIRYILASAATILVLVACATPTPTATPFTLAGSKWTLTSITQNGATRTPGPGTEVTLEFTGDGKVNGNSGCNSYSGTYETQGEILKVGALASTLRACVETEKMELEAAYLAALQGARLFERSADQLTITFAEGNGKMVFKGV